MLTRISIWFSIVAAAALVFASDLLVMHILPRAFEVAEVFAFWCGVACTVLAMFFAVLSLVRNGKTKLGVRVCTWSAAEFLAFGLVYLYGIFSA